MATHSKHLEAVALANGLAYGPMQWARTAVCHLHERVCHLACLACIFVCQWIFLHFQSLFLLQMRSYSSHLYVRP
jgi:hypothetical protein